MTSTITLSCPSGIVLAADTRITYLDSNGQIQSFKDDVKKLFYFSESKVAGSYWGLAELNSKSMLEFLADFESSLTEKDDVNSVSKKLASQLRIVKPPVSRRMGIHLVGYCGHDEVYPQLRHVFHTDWHKDGEFTDEDSNTEYYLPNGARVQNRLYNPFIARFNGDNRVANALFSLIPTLTGEYIILDRLDLSECIRLAKLIVWTAEELLNFYFAKDGGRVRPVVKGLTVGALTKEDFRWIEN